MGPTNGSTWVPNTRVPSEALTPINLREVSIAVPLVAFAILFGIMPTLVLRYMDKSISHQAKRTDGMGRSSLSGPANPNRG